MWSVALGCSSPPTLGQGAWEDVVLAEGIRMAPPTRGCEGETQAFSEALKPPVEEAGGKVYAPPEEACVGRAASMNPFAPTPAQPSRPSM